MKLLNSHEEAHSLGMACWDTAERLKGRGLVPESSDGVDESGFSVTTNLLLAAHELFLAAERVAKKIHPEFEEPMSIYQQLDNALNRAVLLTVAARNVIDQALLSSSTMHDPKNTKGGELCESKAVQVSKALEWVGMAQATCEQFVQVWNSQLEASNTMEQQWKSLAETEASLRVTLSTLRLMCGINGVYSTTSCASSDNMRNKDEDLKLVEDCKADLAIVPPDTLRATASAMKQRGKTSVAFSILNIAIERLQAKLKVHVDSEIIKQLLTLSCDQFHVAPSVDGCLKVVEDILKYLAASKQMVTQYYYILELSIMLFCFHHLKLVTNVIY